MEAILRTLEPNLGARMVWMGLRTKPDAEIEYMDGRLEGTPTSLQPPKLETYVYRCLNRQQCITVPRTGDGVTQSVLAVPIPGEHGPIGLLYADTLRHARVYDDADLDLLTTLASVIAPLLHTPSTGTSDHRSLRPAPRRLDRSPAWSRARFPPGPSWNWRIIRRVERNKTGI